MAKTGRHTVFEGVTWEVMLMCRVEKVFGYWVSKSIERRSCRREDVVV